MRFYTNWLCPASSCQCKESEGTKEVCLARSIEIHNNAMCIGTAVVQSVLEANVKQIFFVFKYSAWRSEGIVILTNYCYCYLLHFDKCCQIVAMGLFMAWWILCWLQPYRICPVSTIGCNIILVRCFFGRPTPLV